jgi:hypothetical protein
MNVSRYITYNANQWTYISEIYFLLKVHFDSLYKYKDDQWQI